MSDWRIYCTEPGYEGWVYVTSIDPPTNWPEHPTFSVNLESVQSLTAFSDTSFFPMEDDTLNLGGAAYRWMNVYLSGGLMGNVFGNLEGFVTGDVTGNVYGTHTGAVFGDVIGNLSGQVTGGLTGDVTGNVYGYQIGDQIGNVTGDVVGNVIGKVTGDITGNVIATNRLVMTGATVINSGTLTFPTSTDTIVARTTYDQLSNKRLDESCYFISDEDDTKRVGFNTDSATTSTTLTLAAIQTANRTITFPDATTMVVGTDVSQTLTNKTIVDSGSNVAANSLKTLTNAVVVNGAAAPSVGQALVATSSSTASWQSMPGVFEEYQEDATQYTTTSTSYTTAVTYTTNNLTSGDYIVRWYAEYGNDTTLKGMQIRLRNNGTTTLGEASRTTTLDLSVGGFNTFSGMKKLAGVSGTQSLTFEIMRAGATLGGTARVKETRIELWKIN